MGNFPLAHLRTSSTLLSSEGLHPCRLIDWIVQITAFDRPGSCCVTPKKFAAETFAEWQTKKELAQLKKKAEGWFPKAQDLNAYAWCLLTCGPVQLRDPRKALKLVEKAVAKSNGKHAGILDTLALAYHRTGDTAKAIETQRKAVALLPPGDSISRTALEFRLAEFKKANGGR